jgi:hypothetical protein
MRSGRREVGLFKKLINIPYHWLKVNPPAIAFPGSLEYISKDMHILPLRRF